MNNRGFEKEKNNYGALESGGGNWGGRRSTMSGEDSSKKTNGPPPKELPPEEDEANKVEPVVHEDLDDDEEPNIFGRIVVGIRLSLYHLVTTNTKFFKILFILAAVLLYHAYLAGAIVYTVDYKTIDWCDNVGFLIILTGFVYWAVFYYFILKRLLGKRIQRGVFKPLQRTLNPLLAIPFVTTGIALAAVVGFVVFVVVDAWDEPQRMISAAGIIVIIALGLIFSKYPGRVKWRQVLWGLALQFIFGMLIIRWPGGRDAFDCISGKVATFLGFTDAGSTFVYGFVASGMNLTTANGDSIKFPTTFYFTNLSVIFFFSFFISILYHFGVMMWVIRKLGWFFQITVGTTAAESMNAAANIFVGQTEAPILIKPFIMDLTPSELNAVMTGGFATISGSVLGAYINFGINPSYLLSSSIMAAPAALALSKLIYPETKVSRTTAAKMKGITLKTSGNALDAATQGAAQAVTLVLNIGANIVAVMAFVAFLNAVINWFGGLIGVDELTFEWLLGKIFIPFAYILGVESEDVEDVALLLGLKTIVNEFVAYERMVSMTHLSERSRVISTYALCSFANLSSIGIQLGGIGAMAPGRRLELAKTISYAFMAGTACGLLNACMAGILVKSGSLPDEVGNMTISTINFT